MTLDWSKYPNFGPGEFRCKGEGCCGGKADMDDEFMKRLQELRTVCGFPFVVTSGYRCPGHNARVNGGPAHPAGKAADIATSGGQAFALVGMAKQFGFTGLGVCQKEANRFIHLDTYDGPDAPRPWVWSY